MNPTLASASHTDLPLLDVAIHMAWVDGRLSADEVSAARSVATLHGLAEAGAGRLGRGPSSPTQFEIAALEAGNREVVYATAVWVALADGVLAPPERTALSRLGRCLRLTGARLEELDDIVWQWAGAHGDWDRRYAGLMMQIRGH